MPGTASASAARCRSTCARCAACCPEGGTLLGTRRGSPYDDPDGPEQVAATFRDMGIDGLVVIGGNGSLTVACKLHHDLGLPIVGVPKTIDNDIVGTDMTFGFTTAVQIATDAIDRLHTTAESHDRVMIVEVMGRHSGWIATYAGIAGGATAILIPEEPFDIDTSASCCSIATSAVATRRSSSSPKVPSRGTTPCRPARRSTTASVTFGSAASPTRSPTPSRRAPAWRPGSSCSGTCSVVVHRRRTTECLSTRYGIAAIDAVHNGDWGKMAVLRGTDVTMIPLTETVGKTRYVDLHLYHDVAEVFFG